MMSNDLLTAIAQVTRVLLAALLFCGFRRPALASALCARADRFGANKRSMIFLIVFGSMIITTTLLIRHYGFETDAYDLRLHEEVVRNTWHGKFMFSDMKGHSFFANHVSLIFPVFALLYPVWPCAAWLLLLQGLCVGGAAWFLWLFAREHGVRPATSLTVTAVFLMYNGLWTGFFDGFHQEVVSIFFLLGFFWAEYKRTVVPAALFCALALSCREDIAIPLATYGAMLCFRKGGRAWGGVILAVCLAWLFLSYGWLIPHFSVGGQIEEISRWSQFGATPREIAIGMFGHPLQTFANIVRGSVVLFGRLLFLPAFDAWTILPILIPLAAHTNSSYDMQAHLQGAYAALFVPYFFAGLVRTLAGPRFRNWLSVDRIAFCLCLLLLLVNVKPLPLPENWTGVCSAQQGLSTLNRCLDGRRVLAQGTIAPHLGWSAKVDMLGSPAAGPFEEYDVILLSLAQRTWPMKRVDLERTIQSLSNSNGWKNISFGNIHCFVKAGDTNW
jgi:uncharacterized membrane protein